MQTSHFIRLGGLGDIYAMNTDGSGLIRLTDNPTMDAFPAWQPRASEREGTR